MRKALFVLSLLLGFLLVAYPVKAQEKKWEFKVELFSVKTGGNDTRVGDLFIYEQKGEVTLDQRDYLLKLLYGAKYTPLVTFMSDQKTPLVSAGYNNGRWGFIFSGWHLNTSGAVGGEVVTGRPFSAEGVRMWDHTIFPLWDGTQNPPVSRVQYWANNSLSLQNADFLFFDRLRGGSSPVAVDLLWGIKLAKLKNDRREGQSQHAFLSDYAGLGKHFDNAVFLESLGHSGSGLLVGPVIGGRWSSKYKTFSFKGTASHAVLFGSARTSGSWRDTDDIYFINGLTREQSTFVFPFIYYDGLFLFADRERVAVPVTEFSGGFFFDLTKHISIGYGVFISTWQGVVLAPEWSVPGPWSPSGGSGWERNKSDLSIYGSTLSLRVVF